LQGDRTLRLTPRFAPSSEFEYSSLTLSVGIELIAEEVVVEGSVRACQRQVSVRRIKIAAIGAETQFRNRCAAGTSPRLHHAGHGVGTIERTLRPAHEFEPIGFRQGNNPEIERSAGFVDGNSVDNDFVIARIAAADEQ
jgi:hypothetical protein